jgi:asparagine synthase (glutamine-hydrolysing)
MCGLVGLLKLGGDTPEALARSAEEMSRTLVHRGPDDAGCYVDAPAGLALGFRRLAILDVSPGGHQPMLSADARYVVVFNGEIYNFQELRVELEGEGHSFKSTSDTEVMLAAVRQWGFAHTVRRLWGMFAIALWDRAERALWLARDRLGKKPLYFAQIGDAFLFGSELKVFHAHAAFRPELDEDAVVAYLRFGYVPTPLSIFRRVAKFPAASFARVKAGMPPMIEPYWRPSEFLGQPPDRDFDDPSAIEQLESLLRDSVRRRMIADVPIGAMLSGGVDSSSVVAFMQEVASQPVRTFTIGFRHSEHDESVAAKAVAAHLGTEHVELFVTPEEARAVIPRLPDLYDEPFADSSQIPTYVLSELTRRYVTVSIAGDGGDELFGGYTRYNWASTAWSVMARLPRTARKWVADQALRVAPDSWDTIYGLCEWALPATRRVRFAGDKIHKFAEIAVAPDGSSFYQGVVSTWKDPLAIVREGYASASRLPALPPALDGVRHESFVEYMMQIDMLTYLPDDILVKVDRASMGASLEVRAPLLDHRIVEWVSRLPMRFKIRNGMSKWLLRQLLYRRVPRELIERPKMGFGVPIGLWLRGPLREWAEELLSERELSATGVFRTDPIRRTWSEHLSGKRNHEHRLWILLMFQAWRRRWMH